MKKKKIFIWVISFNSLKIFLMVQFYITNTYYLSEMAFAKKHLIQALDHHECRMEPQYTQFQTWDNRRQSFENFWPAQLPVQPDTLILNGFFYTRKSDRIVCFYCGGGLHRLTINDDILKLHALFYGGCSFLYYTHPRQTILDLIDANPTHEQEKKAFTVTHSDLIILNMQGHLTQVATLKQKLSTIRVGHRLQLTELSNSLNRRITGLTSRIDQMNKEMDNYERLVTCQICFSRMRDAHPECGHTFCQQCVDHIKDLQMCCPLCRRNVRNVHQFIL